MFIRNNFVVLMFSLKVGKQSIPIWFKCDKTKAKKAKDNDNSKSKNLFSEKVIFDAIDDVIKLLAHFDSKIIFVGDRWFCNLELLKVISDKGHFFCIRSKVNSNIKCFIYDKKEGHKIYKKLSDFNIRQHSSLYFKNIMLGDLKFKCNFSISRGKCNDDPWFIFSNLDPNKAIKTYSKRFGGIETMNGFNLEKTNTKNLHALVCFSTTWCTIIGLDYSKNYHNVKKNLNISFTKKTNTNQIVRIMSLFNLGLTIFRMVYNSYLNYNIKCNLRLYL